MRLSNWKVYSSTLELPNYASVLHYLLGLALKQPSWFWPNHHTLLSAKYPNVSLLKTIEMSRAALIQSINLFYAVWPAQCLDTVGWVTGMASGL